MRVYCSAIILMIFLSNCVGQQNILDPDSLFLPQKSIDYIYSRSLDMILKDQKTTASSIGLFYLDDSEKFETIKVTIDSVYDTNAFHSGYIPEIDNLPFRTWTSTYFPDINAFNNGAEIEYVLFQEIPTLQGNHLVHVIFSSLFYVQNRIFLGVHCINQFSATTGIYNYDTYFIFEAERCRNGIICFRQIYIPWGFGIDGKKIYSKLDAGDRPCIVKR